MPSRNAISIDKLARSTGTWKCPARLIPRSALAIASDSKDEVEAAAAGRARA